MGNQTISFMLMTAEREIELSLGKVSSARTVREVVNAMSPTIPASLRGIQRSLPSFHRLQSQAEERVMRIVKGQILEIKALPGAEREKKTRFYQGQEWPLLRGHFPRAFNYMDREVKQMHREMMERQGEIISAGDQVPATPRQKG